MLINKTLERVSFLTNSKQFYRVLVSILDSLFHKIFKRFCVFKSCHLPKSSVSNLFSAVLRKFSPEQKNTAFRKRLKDTQQPNNQLQSALRVL